MNKHIEYAKKKANGAKPKYYQDGNFFCCVIVHGKREYCGFAKCNCNCDEYNEERGRRIAYERALKKIVLSRKEKLVSLAVADVNTGRMVHN